MERIPRISRRTSPRNLKRGAAIVGQNIKRYGPQDATKKEVSFCPHVVAAAYIHGVFDYCLVSIAKDASTLSDGTNESHVQVVS